MVLPANDAASSVLTMAVTAAAARDELLDVSG
jgi:hypothetical protein